MHTVNKLSYIIAFNQEYDSLRNLNLILNFLKKFSNIEIIIVEYGSKYPILDTKVGVNTLFIKTEGVYTNAKAWNYGLKYSTSDHVLFSSVNDITEPKYLEDAMKKILDDSNIDMIKLYDQIIELEDGEYKSDLSKINPKNKPISQEDARKTYISDGLFIIKKDTFLKLGGWDESTKLWKYDAIQDFKFYKYRINMLINENIGYKLKYNKLHNNELMSHDINIFNKLKTISDNEFNMYIHISKTKMGNPMEYEI